MSTTAVLQFTQRERDAICHELSHWNRFAALFERRGHAELAERANARAHAIYDSICRSRSGKVYLERRELDQEVMACAVEESGWVRLHARAHHQLQSATFGALQSAAGKVEEAFGLRKRLRVPVD